MSFPSGGKQATGDSKLYTVDSLPTLGPPGRSPRWGDRAGHPAR
ncbi:MULTISPECIES: hypothetical protein [unclassified Limnothrix]|nr:MULTISPECIES: hypothetical protein [unclassified Limnothrix]